MERARRFTDDEKIAHIETPRHKARGGSTLIGGRRSHGRWAAGCSCGWERDSNEGRAAAAEDWRSHRAGVAWEARRLGSGLPIYRIIEAWDEARGGDTIREWRAITGTFARDFEDPKRACAVVRREVSDNGITWRPMGLGHGEEL